MSTPVHARRRAGVPPQRGRSREAADVDVYGVDYQDRQIRARSRYPRLGRRQRSQLVDSVLASWQWK